MGNETAEVSVKTKPAESETDANWLYEKEILANDVWSLALQCSILYCTALLFTVLHCTELHYTTIYCTSFLPDPRGAVLHLAFQLLSLHIH